MRWHGLQLLCKAFNCTGVTGQRAQAFAVKFDSWEQAIQTVAEMDKPCVMTYYAPQRCMQKFACFQHVSCILNAGVGICHELWLCQLSFAEWPNNTAVNRARQLRD
jgi:hypothetical protein